MTVKDIVTAHLKAHGFDGLCNQFGECACQLGDLFPCESPVDECQPGYLGPSPDPDDDNDFGIYATREAVEEAKAAQAAKGDES